MARREENFVVVEAQEESPVEEHDSREKDEEEMEEEAWQWEKGNWVVSNVLVVPIAVMVVEIAMPFFPINYRYQKLDWTSRKKKLDWTLANAYRVEYLKRQFMAISLSLVDNNYL